MCSVPVTLGGGSWIENDCFDASKPALKYPFDSQKGYQRDSMPLGSKAFASSMAYFFLLRAAIASWTASAMDLASSWRTSPSAPITAACIWGWRCWARRASRSCASRPSTWSITRLKTSWASSSAAALSSTKSVSTGKAPVSEPAPVAWRFSSASARPSTSFSNSAGTLLTLDVVHLDVVAALLVERMAVAGLHLVLLVGRDDLEHAIERREERRPFVGKVQQHFVVRELFTVGAQHHGRLHRERRVRIDV